MTPLNIGLDYDGTYTADPDLWEEFIRNATLTERLTDDPTQRTAKETIPVAIPAADGKVGGVARRGPDARQGLPRRD